MLFTDRDLGKVRVATAPDPMWEITNSLDRLQTSKGRWAYARWYGDTRAVLADTGFERTVRSMLVPLLPRAAYFPDFLTPAEARAGLEAGLEAILGTPRTRVAGEIQKLAVLHRAPAWAHRVADHDLRREVVDALRTYHDLVIAPHDVAVRAAVDQDRAVRARAFLDGGVEQLLDSFRPMMRWSAPALEVSYPVRRDIELNGRAACCWSRPTSAGDTPVALVDPDLPPVLIYPVLSNSPPDPADNAAADLLGATRAAVLGRTRDGATTSEIARMLGISAQTVSHHLGKLRGSGLVRSQRRANTVLHVLTPLGAALLTPPPPT